MSALTTLASVLKKNAIDWLGKIILAGFVGVVISLYDPVRDAIAIRWNILMTLDDRLQSIEHDVSSWEKAERVIRADIAALRSPAQVFEISTFLSAPVNGYCVVGKRCPMRLFIRRVPGAEECRIQGDRTEHFLRSLVDGIARQVPSIRTGPATNLGADWTEVNLSIVIPDDIPVGSANYLLVAYYISCNGQTAEFVRDESLPIPVDIREDE